MFVDLLQFIRSEDRKLKKYVISKISCVDIIFLKKYPNQLKVQTPKMEGFTFTIKSHACSAHTQMLTVRPHFSLLYIWEDVMTDTQ